MKTIYSIIIVLVLTSNIQAQSELILQFETDKYATTPTHQALINRFLDSVGVHHIKHVEITGYTDTVANDAYNITLSKKRAIDTKQLLMKSGIAESLISHSYFGEYTNAQLKEKMNNRCVIVEFHVQKPVSNGQAIPLFIETDKKPGSIGSIYDSLAVKPQIFTIQNNENIVIRGKLGTIITIPKHAFDAVKKDEEIKIKIKEVYSKQDMILEHLTTLSNGGMLESDGMIQITASLNDIPLRLKENISIEIKMPTKEIKDNMQPFYGEHTVDGGINWTTNLHPAKTNSNNGNKRNHNRGTVEMKSLVENNMSYYVFNAQKLGWFNCDRFLTMNPKITYLVRNINSRADVKLVFRKFKCILPGIYGNNWFEFNSVPLNEKVFIVALKFENNKAMLAIKESTITSAGEDDFVFETLSVSEIRERLKVLDD